MNTSQRTRRANSALFAGALFVLACCVWQPSAAQAQWATNGTNINNTNTGNVGIGTSTPSTILQISSPARPVFSATGMSADKARVGQITVADAIFSYNAGFNSSGTYDLDDTTKPGWVIDLDNGTYNGMYFQYVPAGANPRAQWPTFMYIHPTGNVGIGTTTPQSLLDISGNAGLTLRNSGGSSGFSFFDRPTVPGDQVVLQGNTGNYSVVNVSTKGANVGTEKASGMAFWTVDIANTNNATQFQFQYSPTFGPLFFTQKFGTGAQGDKKISFQTVWQQAVTPTQLVLDTNGNVGVGTATPATKLHVAGDITVTGNINAKYQDVAEWVPSKQKLAAGTVVILDTEHDNHVTASATAYDTRVAGVVSIRPGIALGEAGEGKLLVATTGRVRVRVDATRAPIHIGDLLVTSDVAGVAMRSEPIVVGGRRMHAPGTIIGKALEPLERGTGEILVLLSLQ